jgi:hypothetical protein
LVTHIAFTRAFTDNKGVWCFNIPKHFYQFSDRFALPVNDLTVEAWQLSSVNRHDGTVLATNIPDLTNNFHVIKPSKNPAPGGLVTIIC